MPNNSDLLELAKVFGPPFIVVSKNLNKSLRATCFNLGIPSILFEGGKSLSSDKEVVKKGVDGVTRVLTKLDMLDEKFIFEKTLTNSIIIEKSKWLRANKSGLLHVKIDCGKLVKKDEFLATITDPYGTMRYIVRAPNEGYIINVNHSPIVHQGDAIFHISTDYTSNSN
jgi:predicted deacylase